MEAEAAGDLPEGNVTSTRSGRVTRRRTSSKQSPPKTSSRIADEETPPRSRRSSRLDRASGESCSTATLSPTKSIKDDHDDEMSDFDDIDLKDEDDWELPDDDSSFLKLAEEDFKNEEALGLPCEDFDFPDEDFDMDDDTDLTHEDGEDSVSGRDAAGGAMAQSLYLSEKGGGKKGLYFKNGQPVVRKKAQRKDKGKSRFTAYMLWAREVRPNICKKHPDMDFASVNKKLGELWQLVPITQKYNWKRRAKRLASRLRQSGGVLPNSSLPSVADVNKSSSSSSSATAGGRHAAGRKAAVAKPLKPTTPRSKGSNSVATAVRSSARTSSSLLSPSSSSEQTISSGPFKVTGTAAIDVAAHMKLLGESLNNIGHKLKEHEGQIAVSGSLSVLLDSMLCVLGPLMCLTDQVPELRGAIDQQTHTAVLDNIAYIMPGIV